MPRKSQSKSAKADTAVIASSVEKETVTEVLTGIIPPTLPKVSTVFAAEVAAVRYVPSFVPACLSEKGQDLFTLFWALLDSKQRNLHEIEAICEIFINLDDRKIEGKTKKDKDQAWSDMVENARRLVPIAGGVTYGYIGYKLAQSASSKWNDFFDQMESILDRRGRFIVNFLKDELTSDEYTEKLMLAMFMSLVRVDRHRGPLTEICKLFIGITKFDYDVESEEWNNAELDLMKKILENPDYHAAYEALITALIPRTVAERESFYQQIGNVLGGGDQAFALMLSFATQVDARLEKPKSAAILSSITPFSDTTSNSATPSNAKFDRAVGLSEEKILGASV